jgi:hypothetical protein
MLFFYLTYKIWGLYVFHVCIKECFMRKRQAKKGTCAFVGLSYQYKII